MEITTVVSRGGENYAVLPRSAENPTGLAASLLRHPNILQTALDLARQELLAGLGWTTPGLGEDAIWVMDWGQDNDVVERGGCFLIRRKDNGKLEGINPEYVAAMFAGRKAKEANHRRDNRPVINTDEEMKAEDLEPEAI